MTNDQISPRGARARSSTDLATRAGDHVFFLRDWLFKARVRIYHWFVARSPGQRAGATQLAGDIVALLRSGQVGELARRFYWLPIVTLLVVAASYTVTMAWFDAMRN